MLACENKSEFKDEWGLIPPTAIFTRKKEEEQESTVVLVNLFIYFFLVKERIHPIKDFSRADPER